MKRIFMAAMAAMCGLAGAAERRELASIPMAALVNETQRMYHHAAGMAMVWWIPTEFWVTAVLQRGPGNEDAANEVRKAFKDYVVLGVVDASQKAIGGFDFQSRDSVLGRMRVYADAAEFMPVAKPHRDAQLITDMMKPLFASMLGDLGAHIHIVLLSSEKRRPPSGYEKTTLKVTLAPSGEGQPATFEFVAPLDSLHVPRKCPNGREAHISWNFCPWDGTKLPD
jgi:hypothetical protein